MDGPPKSLSMAPCHLFMYCTLRYGTERKCEHELVLSVGKYCDNVFHACREKCVTELLIIMDTKSECERELVLSVAKYSNNVFHACHEKCVSELPF